MDLNPNEENEDMCWKLLQELKPDNEKLNEINNEIDEYLCEKCNSRDIIVIEGEHLCK